MYRPKVTISMDEMQWLQGYYKIVSEVESCKVTFLTGTGFLFCFVLFLVYFFILFCFLFFVFVCLFVCLFFVCLFVYLFFVIPINTFDSYFLNHLLESWSLSLVLRKPHPYNSTISPKVLAVYLTGKGFLEH